MESAAICIDDLANNVIGRYPILDVSMPDNLDSSALALKLTRPFYFLDLCFKSTMLSIRCIPNGGLAVGPGVRYEPPARGQDLEAAPRTHTTCLEALLWLKENCSHDSD